MKASETKLLNFLKNAPQFVIPIYQRTYCWTEKECLQLWDDIVRTGADDSIAVHFIGSVVYIDKADANIAMWEPLLVIDGQQRLTTVTLLLAALSNVKDAASLMEDFSAEKIHEYYLCNRLENGERKFKLILSQTDKTSLIAIVDNHDQPQEYSLRITKNFELFENLILSQKGDLSAVCKGLAKLLMVDVKLKRGEDNPQLIFESMNSLGKELSEADLIRNYILMGLEPELQKRLYEQFWRPMEVAFGQEAYGAHFDAFMRHYLTVKTGEIPNINAVYDAFKEYARVSRVNAIDDKSHIDGLVRDIRDYSKYFCAMALNSEPDVDLKLAFHDLRELKVDVAYPFLLELYHDYNNKILIKDEFLKIVRLIESYVFRRAICGIPTNSMNKTFGNFSRSLKKDTYLESVQANFLLLPSYRRFPKDDEFKREIKVKDIYNFRIRSYWLRRLENYGRKEHVNLEDYTIEHVMPQNENLSPEWKSELGDDWEIIHKTYLHTIGNLTLTRYNSEYSDRSFLEKRNMKGGFAESPVILNKEIALKEHWGKEDILSRAETLSTQAVCVWSDPQLDQDILDKYKTKTEKHENRIESYPQLNIEPVKSLFDEFRKQVLALDPCVTETFLFSYVAYKAETNFVDVIPMAKCLRLTLNMAFADINDPKKICKDVSDIGHWGNGDVEVKFSNIEDITYIIGLVRQSFDNQQGDSE